MLLQTASREMHPSASLNPGVPLPDKKHYTPFSVPSSSRVVAARDSDARRSRGLLFRSETHRTLVHQSKVEQDVVLTSSYRGVAASIQGDTDGPC